MNYTEGCPRCGGDMEFNGTYCENCDYLTNCMDYCCSIYKVSTTTSEPKGGKLTMSTLNLNRSHQTLLVIDGRNGSGRASRVVDSLNRSGGDYDDNGTIKADVLYVNGEEQETASAKEIRQAAADAGYNGVITYRAL